MITLLWASGIIAKAPARIDAGGFAYGSGSAKRHLESLALEQFAAKAVTLARAVKAKPQAQKRAREAVHEMQAMSVPQDLIDRLGRVSASLERMSDDRADYAAALQAFAEQVADMERVAKAKARRRREEERLITFLVGVA